MKGKRWIVEALGAAAIATTGSTVFATEGGGSAYPNGAENYYLGAMPPPGFYTIEYLVNYRADKLYDNNGNRIPVDFNVDVAAAATDVVWVTDQKVFGGQLAFYSIIPLIKQTVNFNGTSQTKSGLGDITFVSILGYHPSVKLHYIFALDFHAPTAAYNKNDVNPGLGRNYWTVEPAFAFSYIQSHGVNGDLRVMYDFNGRNKDTSYRSGQELHADFSLGWGFGNALGYGIGNRIVAGVGGYVYRQTTDDNFGGVTVQSNRGKSMAIGPSVKYDSGRGFFITVKYQKEFNVANRAKGDGVYIKMLIPF